MVRHCHGYANVHVVHDVLVTIAQNNDNVVQLPEYRDVMLVAIPLVSMLRMVHCRRDMDNLYVVRPPYRSHAKLTIHHCDKIC